MGLLIIGATLVTVFFTFGPWVVVAYTIGVVLKERELYDSAWFVFPAAVFVCLWEVAAALDYLVWGINPFHA